MLTRRNLAGAFIVLAAAGIASSAEQSSFDEEWPRHPRLLLLQGIDTFHRPRMFGGGIDRAERWFRSAVGFFEAQPADRPWPDWGRAEAYAWLGRTLARLGDTAAAREQYMKALDVESEFACGARSAAAEPG